MPELTANASALTGATGELIGLALAGVLTLAVLSYALGDNIVFRWVQYLFVGLAAGYAGVLAWQHVLWPKAYFLMTDTATYWYYGIFFALGILMLARGIGPISAVANLPLGVMVGTGAGLALGGALTGTLVPQLQAAIVSLNPADYAPSAMGWLLAIDALLTVLITICVLCAFHYTASGTGFMGRQADRLVSGLGALGRRLIMLGLGVLIAGALLSFFSLLSSRIDFIIESWQAVRSGMGF